MTVIVHFEEPQMRVENGETGVEISQIVMPYSIRNTEDPSQYLGGQVVLTKEDGIAFTDNTEDWDAVALAKVKDMVAVSEIYVPTAMSEEPALNEEEAAQDEQ